MKVAVLSGKGGAGKTTLAVNLAAVAGEAVCIDCDVEEPNDRLYFKPDATASQPVFTHLPVFDPTKCTGCRRCLEFCRFHALVYVKNKPMVFPEVCHACGGCALVCPAGAVSEEARPIGRVITGRHRQVQVVTGLLNEGESSGIPVIKAALKTGFALGDTVVIDCPPGSACSVTESIAPADVCVLAAEPTAFGLDNIKMVYELVRLLGKPCGLVINKEETPYAPLEAFCRREQLPIWGRLPFSRALAAAGAAGRIAAEEDPAMAAFYTGLWKKIGGEAL